jgi:hypothetical protein
LECIERMLRSILTCERRIVEALLLVPDSEDEPTGESARVEHALVRLLEEYRRRLMVLTSEVEWQALEKRDFEAARQRCLAAEDPVELEGLLLGAKGQAAWERWQEAARAGRTDAQFIVACVLLEGMAGPPDPESAVRWLESAERQKHAPSMFVLGGFLDQRSADRNERRSAMELLCQAANAGSADARFIRAMLATAGAGESMVREECRSLLQLSAEDGHAEAQLALGQIYAADVASGVDHASAVKWFSLAANQHRWMAIDWLNKYGALSPEAYENVVWQSRWEPDAEPPPRRAGRVARLLSLGFLFLVIVATIRGNSLGVILIFMFLCVVVHELGHFLAARLVGVPIRVFSVGAGPLLWSWWSRRRRLPTRFDVRLVPVMGYVRAYSVPRGVWNHWQDVWSSKDAGRPLPPIPQFDRSEPETDAARFVSRPRRLVFYMGGVVANFIFAVAFLWAYSNWTPSGSVVTAPVAGPVPPGSVADLAGLQEGDRFLAVDGTEITRGFPQVRARLASARARLESEGTDDLSDRSIEVSVLRGDSELTIEWPAQAPVSPDGEKRPLGLVRPHSWIIEDVQESHSEVLHEGDRIIYFDGPLGLIETSQSSAYELLHVMVELNGSRGVALTILRPGENQPRRVILLPLPSDRPTSDSAFNELPFELAGIREAGAIESLAGCRRVGVVWCGTSVRSPRRHSRCRQGSTHRARKRSTSQGNEARSLDRLGHFRIVERLPRCLESGSRTTTRRLPSHVRSH